MKNETSINNFFLSDGKTALSKTHAALFNGIGGFQLAAEWMGWDNVMSCEIVKVLNQVTKYYYPNCIQHEDIKTTDFTIWRNKIDILTGGFPCQPYSSSGKRLGKEDERHLWPEMLRAIREIRPAFVVAENVSGLITMENGKTLEGVFSDLENEGYKVEPCLIPACGVGAWHRRERIWIIAYTCDRSDSANGNQKGEKEGIQGKRKQERCTGEPIGTNTSFHPNDRSKRNERFEQKEIPELKGIQRCENFGRSAILGNRPDIPTPVLCRSYDGIPNGVDRIKALGNAIVPQVAFEIFRAVGVLNAKTLHETNL